jgi:circadian clock protein KaiB
MFETNAGDHQPGWGAAPSTDRYVLRLFVTGLTRRSQQAIAAITTLCDELLAGRYDLEIVDIYDRPGELEAEQIIASPTLLRKHPLPLRRLVGDLSDRNRVMAALDLVRP